MAHVSGGVRLPPLETTPTVRQLYELAAHAGECLDYYIHAEHSKGAAESRAIGSSVLGLPVLCSMGPEGAGHATRPQNIFALPPSFRAAN